MSHDLDDILSEIEDSQNGHFMIEQADGKAMLKVYPPGKKGQAVAVTDVVARLELFGIRDFKKNHIEEIVFIGDAQAHAVATWAGPKTQDATIKINLSTDCMQAHIHVKPARHGGRKIDEAMLAVHLKEQGIVFGIIAENTAEVQRLSAEGPLKGADVLIARGKPAVSGNPGQVAYHFNTNPQKTPIVVDEGPVDFREIDIIQTCQADQLLAELFPPGPGMPGTTVLGENKLPVEVKESSLQAGLNCRLNEDNNKIYALMEGQIKLHTDLPGVTAQIDVLELLVLEQVDYSTGHIEFPGSVQIEGTVFDGFHVKAGGDIHIEKSVGQVELEAAGDIVLVGGALCKGQGFIRAGANVYARFVQDAHLHAGESIFIEELVMNSRIVSGADIVIAGGRGELVGGSAVCTHSLRATRIGNRMEVATEIRVGVAPEVLERIQSLEEEFGENQQTLLKIETRLSQIEEQQKRGRELDEEEEITLSKLELLRTRYMGFIKNIDDQRQALYNTIKPDPDARVIAGEIVYPGVEVHFGAGVRRYLVEGRAIVSRSRFELDDGHIYLRH